MFDLGWSELLVVGVVALIVVGPKDLPVMFRNVGRFVGKARGMAREFSRAMEAAADEAGMKDIDKTLKAAANPRAMGLDALRDAAGLKQTSPAPVAAAKAAAPVAAAPVAAAPAAAAPVTAVGPKVKPGGETEALIKKRTAAQASAQRKATEKAAERALGKAGGAASPADAPQDGDKTP
jgi:sec-independent protein translocase protein TatB